MNLLKRKAQQRANARRASRGDRKCVRAARGAQRRFGSAFSGRSKRGSLHTLQRYRTIQMGREMTDCLRLKAVDAEDLSVVAACLQGR